MAPEAHQTDKLVKAGLEGFALLDEFYGRKKKPGRAPVTQAHDHYHHGNYNHQQRHVYRAPQVMWEPVMDSDQAAILYGGMAIVDYGVKKPIAWTY